ncbi:MAG: hypothetical protein LBO65_10170 [Spirochaetaceae bacterium]|jgi:apolipoprotein N-acyltransferase|nr:hypothetical protein [Spirochaetaceae bacterium]
MKRIKTSLSGKPFLFMMATVFITLTISFPLFSPLLFGVFSVIFELIRGEKLEKQLRIIFSLFFTVSLLVFTNLFFVYNQIPLFLITSLYFAFLLGTDLFIVFHILKYKYALLLIFGYIALSRFTLCLSTAFFPFYWTLTMQLLPFMGVISRFFLPVFWEALCVAFAAVRYFSYSHRPLKHFLVQAGAIMLTAVTLTHIMKGEQDRFSLKPGLVCTIIQGGYSRQDYELIERYPVLGLRMADKYLGYIKETKNARLLILPESAFPVQQTEDSEILQDIKNTARERNEYIMTGVLLEEDKKVYNAAAFIDPNGLLQNVYRKRTTVLFVETLIFSRGTTANTFSVDGYTIAPLICYESLFIRNYFREKRPELYIVISNDIFAEKTILTRLHQAYGVINARTMGIPLLQATQNGPSFYINSQGGFSELTRPYEQVIGLPVEIR